MIITGNQIEKRLAILGLRKSFVKNALERLMKHSAVSFDYQMLMYMRKLGDIEEQIVQLDTLYGIYQANVRVSVMEQLMTLSSAIRLQKTLVELQGYYLSLYGLDGTERDNKWLVEGEVHLKNYLVSIAEKIPLYNTVIQAAKAIEVEFQNVDEGLFKDE